MRIKVGTDWLSEMVDSLTERIEVISPVDFNEEHRYLPSSVSALPGYIRFDVNPYMREILNCCDRDHPATEIVLKKGVQITYTTLLESIIFYYLVHIKTLPVMYVSVDKQLAQQRVEANIIPMLNLSGFGDIIKTADEGNSRKTGKTREQISVEGGATLVPIGAQNPAKMRATSIAVLLRDEIDGWPDTVGKNGDPLQLTADRCSAYWASRKIFSGSTPLLKDNSKIEKQYLRGDQRKYQAICKACKLPQELRWKHFKWDYKDGSLDLDSVRYHCKSCNEPHYEHDKMKMFSEENGAHWLPTAKPVEPGIRSYHLPAFYSTLQPWYKAVVDYLDAYNPEEKRVKDIEKFQVFYNNILGEPFEILGAKIKFETVSALRSSSYQFGQIPNEYAEKITGHKISLLTCTVDVHKKNLAVAVFGWTKGSISFLVDYWRFEVKEDEPDCTQMNSPAWKRLRELIDEKEYLSDDGRKYRIGCTLIDSGYANDVVTRFTREYVHGVYPIIGRDRSSRYQAIKEFTEFKTQAGNQGYKIVVDFYKDRLAPVMRREWIEEDGIQKAYHFNMPINATDKQIKELTVESRKKKIDEKGIVSYFWHRPGNAKNELWDLCVYGQASVEIIAYNICIKHFELDTVDWDQFWQYLEEQKLFFS